MKYTMNLAQIFSLDELTIVAESLRQSSDFRQSELKDFTENVCNNGHRLFLSLDYNIKTYLIFRANFRTYIIVNDTSLLKPKLSFNYQCCDKIQ